MSIKEAKKYLEGLKLFDDFIVEKLGKGNNSETFLIKEKSFKYVMRVSRVDVPSNNNLFTQYKFLKFLESEKINFVQRAVHYDKKKKILITSFLEGDNIIYKKLSSKQFNDLVNKIIKINSLKYSNFIKFCKKSRFKSTKPLSAKDSFREHGSKRANYVIKYCDKKELVNWAREHAKKTGEKIGKSHKIKKNLTFIHGDLTGANIILSNNSIYFIDWDVARFEYRQGYELAYMIIHLDYFLENKDRLIKLYAKKTKLNYEFFSKKIYDSMFIVKTTNVIWAAWMYTKMKKEKIRGADKYYKLFLKREKEYNKLFK